MGRSKKIDQLDFIRVKKIADDTSPEAWIYLNLTSILYLREEDGKTKVVYQGREGFFVFEDARTIFLRAYEKETQQ